MASRLTRVRDDLDLFDRPAFPCQKVQELQPPGLDALHLPDREPAA